MTIKTQCQLATEYPAPDELQDTQETIEFLKTKMEEAYSPNALRRDAHPKHHGIIKAEFIIEDNLAEELQVGIFKQGLSRPNRSFPAWIRFSNASNRVHHDKDKDMIGFAIKLMGVEGDKILNIDKEPYFTDALTNDSSFEEEKYTQDFVFMSHPVFLVPHIKDFKKLITAAFGKNSIIKFFFNPFDSHLRTLWILLTMNKQHTSPLDNRYWSNSAFQFGSSATENKRAVKYALLPTSKLQSKMPKNKTENYLKEAMKEHLSKEEASFDFMVQFQTDAVKMPIEDTTVDWPETLSPLIKVATIKIPKQTFDSAEQMIFAENAYFAAWHSLPEHRPLGNINRARRFAYDQLSKFRLMRNKLPRLEPDGSEKF
jgi:catalase